MKYLNGLKIRFFVALSILLTILANSVFMIESYGKNYYGSSFFVYLSLNMVIIILLCIYCVILDNQAEKYKERINKKK